MAMMKAVRIHEFGGPEALIYEDAPKPEPKEGEVLIRVAAVGINPVDWMTQSGVMEQIVPHSLPLIPGWDVAGVMEAIGPDVSAFKGGDAVFVMADIGHDGAYAEYVVVSADLVCPKPASVNFTTAAAIPLSCTTAWLALTEQADLRSGQTILIHGAGGSVGGFAVQLAKVKGAKVIATATGTDVDYVRSLGADVVVDYKTEKFEEAARGVDAVLDPIGGDTQARSWQTLREGGRLVTTLGITSSLPAATMQGVEGKAFAARSDGAILAEIARLVDAGRVRARIDSIHLLSQARQAQAHARTGHPHGKVVLEVAKLDA
jgi:NADPH:quinone reductase-like Zn-dependent oxidoreductase